jgi:hypothetical protein
MNGLPSSVFELMTRMDPVIRRRIIYGESGTISLKRAGIWLENLGMFFRSLPVGEKWCPSWGWMRPFFSLAAGGKCRLIAIAGNWTQPEAE